MSKLIFRLFFSFLVFVGVFILIQNYLTPSSFGKYGHYRADAIEEAKVITPYFKGEEKCASCHQDIYDLKYSDLHSEVRCESCHPPKITAATECEILPPIIEGSIEFCGQCHAINAGRLKKGVPQLDIEEHEGSQNCIECHNSHAPWELKE
ncbi:MAG: hypothetical protein COB01_00390 [Lutibacter sp.]|nr:MAG: hypothetical protein COB01_00390 [Lutibacter sp.]